jgi:hypothetical protein
MIFCQKKKFVWCDDPEDHVICMFAGYLANHDRSHSLTSRRAATGKFGGQVLSP